MICSDNAWPRPDGDGATPTRRVRLPRMEVVGEGPIATGAFALRRPSVLRESSSSLECQKAVGDRRSWSPLSVASISLPSARMTARKAWAKRARVMCVPAANDPYPKPFDRCYLLYLLRPLAAPRAEKPDASLPASHTKAVQGDRKPLAQRRGKRSWNARIVK